ncbi:hypothetical protein BGZ49_002436 [Haplosporangium sp. Z 27]|nr:hypothetical protein BGZ49_002436 [Haplosporangium sp. Z 27]
MSHNSKTHTHSDNDDIDFSDNETTPTSENVTNLSPPTKIDFQHMIVFTPRGQEDDSEEDEGDEEDREEDEEEEEEDYYASRLSFMELLRNSIFSQHFGRSKGGYHFPLTFKTIHPSSPRFSERLIPRNSSLPILDQTLLPLRSEPRAIDWNPDLGSMEIFIPLQIDDKEDEKDKSEDEGQVEDLAEEKKIDKEVDEERKRVIREANEKFDNEYGIARNAADSDEESEEDIDENDTTGSSSKRRRRPWFLDGWDEVWEVPDCRQFEPSEPIVYEIMRPSDMTIVVLAPFISEEKFTSLYDGVKVLRATWVGPKPLSRQRNSAREKIETIFTLWDTTHIVTEVDSIEELQNYMQVRNIPGKIMVVRIEWLEEMIREKKTIDPRPYSLRKVLNMTTPHIYKSESKETGKVENRKDDKPDDMNVGEVNITSMEMKGIDDKVRGENDNNDMNQNVQGQKRSLEHDAEESLEIEAIPKKVRKD